MRGYILFLRDYFVTNLDLEKNNSTISERYKYQLIVENLDVELLRTFDTANHENY